MGTLVSVITCLVHIAVNVMMDFKVIDVMKTLMSVWRIHVNTGDTASIPLDGTSVTAVMVTLVWTAKMHVHQGEYFDDVTTASL